MRLGQRPRLPILFSVALMALLACRASRSPTVAPTESPPPTPIPFPPPPLPCPLPPGGGTGENCPYDPALFALAVNEAIGTVENEHPELFDFGQSLGGLSYFVKDTERYTGGVVYVLSTRGFCAVFDGEELGLKNTNAFNEQYKILTSQGFVRWGGGAYQSTCYPAWF